MPEGQVVHGLARALTARMVGDVVHVRSSERRFAAASTAIEGKALVNADAWGKHLFLAFRDAPSLHVHLGKVGHAHVRGPDDKMMAGARVHLAAARATFDLVAPMTCALVDASEHDAVIAKLGPDPLRAEPDAHEDAFVAALTRSPKKAIGALLLDQAVAAGVGNVFRNEVLHRLRVHPGALASSLDDPRALWRSLRAMMQQALADGRIVTIDLKDPAARASIPLEEARVVYKQERCRTCASPIVTSTIGGRTAYVCPACQPG